MILSGLLVAMLSFSPYSVSSSQTGVNIVSFSDDLMNGDEYRDVNLTASDERSYPLLSYNYEVNSVYDGNNVYQGYDVLFNIDGGYTSFNIQVDVNVQVLDPFTSAVSVGQFNLLLGQYGSTYKSFGGSFFRADDIMESQDLQVHFDFTLTLIDDEEITSYQEGYDDGYSTGYNAGSTDGYNDGYTKGYNAGDNAGYYRGVADGARNGYGFMNLFMTVADTPVMMIRRLFDFSIFGTSMIAVILSLFTAILLIKVITKILK